MVRLSLYLKVIHLRQKKHTLTLFINLDLKPGQQKMNLHFAFSIREIRLVFSYSHLAPTQFCCLPDFHLKTLFLTVSPFSLVTVYKNNIGAPKIQNSFDAIAILDK